MANLIQCDNPECKKQAEVYGGGKDHPKKWVDLTVSVRDDGQMVVLLCPDCANKMHAVVGNATNYRFRRAQELEAQRTSVQQPRPSSSPSAGCTRTMSKKF